MSVLFYCPWHDKKEWIKQIRKIFNKNNIFTIDDNVNFSKIEYAIVWELPNKIYKKLTNLKLIFSMGAGVDHILNLASYHKVPIVRLKDPLMAERMSNHVVSQVLQYQLNLKNYMEGQKKRKWMDFIIPVSNSNIKIGILGVGFLGSDVGNTLLDLGYQVQGYKLSKPKKTFKFSVLFQLKDLRKFIRTSDVIVSVLPSTIKTFKFINKNFLKLMKNKALLINVGRGSTINEEDLIRHLKVNRNFYASLDVFNNEPLQKNHPYWILQNVTITPHVASVTGINSAVEHMYKKFKEFKKKKKFKSDVNIEKGY